MLYTFSKAGYDVVELTAYFQQMTTKDAVVLWQDGVLLPLKYPEIFAKCTALCYALDIDLTARNLTTHYTSLSHIQPLALTALVEMTADYFPQIGL